MNISFKRFFYNEFRYCFNLFVNLLHLLRLEYFCFFNFSSFQWCFRFLYRKWELTFFASFITHCFLSFGWGTFKCYNEFCVIFIFSTLSKLWIKLYTEGRSLLNFLYYGWFLLNKQVSTKKISDSRYKISSGADFPYKVWLKKCSIGNVIS